MGDSDVSHFCIFAYDVKLAIHRYRLFLWGLGSFRNLQTLVFDGA